MTEPYFNRPFAPYIPKTVGEIWDKLGSMMLGAPTFVDELGDFPGMNIDTEFFALRESFEVVRKKLGEERYARLVALADRAKAAFVADPADAIDNGMPGRRLLTEMEEVLNEVRRRR